MAQQLAQYPAPAGLVGAIQQQRGVRPVAAFRGGALDYLRFKKEVLAHVQQHFRTGTAAPTSAYVIFADISSYIQGPLETWHRRSWELLTHLRMWVLRDWVASGPTLGERSARCRRVVQAVSAEDLKGSVLMTTLQWARATYYLFNPGRLPVQQTYIPHIQPDGSSTLLRRESQCSAVEQAFMDNFAAETQPHLQHAFLIPQSASTPSCYRDTFTAGLGDPLQEVSEDIEVLAAAPPASPASVRAPLGHQALGSATPEHRSAADPSGSSVRAPLGHQASGAAGSEHLPGASPPGDSIRAPLGHQALGAAGLERLPQTGGSNEHVSQTVASEQLSASASHTPHPIQLAFDSVVSDLRRNNPFAPDEPAAASIPLAAPAPALSAAAPAASRASQRTIITRQYRRHVHPEWPYVRDNCSTAGDLQVGPHFLNDMEAKPFCNRLENEPFLRRFLVGYADRLREADNILQPEDVYLGFLQWHEVNKPTTELEQSMMALVPVIQPGQPKQPLADIDNWDVLFNERFDTISPWAPWLPEHILAEVYEVGLRRIHQQCFERIMPQLATWRHLPLKDQTTKARRAMHEEVTQSLKWRDTDVRLQAQQPRSRPVTADRPAAAPQQRSDSRGTQQQQQPRPQQREQQRAPQQQQSSAAVWQRPAAQQRGGPSRSVTFADGAAYNAAADSISQFRDPQGRTWYSNEADAFATALTPRPASMTPSPPPRSPRTSFPTFIPKPDRRSSQQRTSVCSECGDRHHVERCPILNPRDPPANWAGPPKGDLHLYCKYVENARRMGMPEQAMRSFTDAQGRSIAPSTALPAGPLRSSLVKSQDTRREVTSRGSASANAALREAVEDDPALDSITRFAFTSSIHDDLFELHDPIIPIIHDHVFNMHYTDYEFEYPQHQPSAAQQQQFYDIYVAEKGSRPCYREMRVFNQCFAITRAQAVQAEALTRGAAAASGSVAPPGQPGSPPASPTAPAAPREQLPAPSQTAGPATQPPSPRPASRSTSPARVSTTGRLRPPVPFTADPVDPSIPPSQLPDAQRRGRPGYSFEGVPVLPAARIPLPANPVPGRAVVPATHPLPAVFISQHLAERFKPVPSRGLSATVQYLLDQGPHIVEQALAANGGAMFSFMDQLHFIPLSQMLVRMPDPTALQAGAPTVSSLPALPTTSNPAAASQQLPPQPAAAVAMLCTGLEEPGMPALVEPSQLSMPHAAASQQLLSPTTTAEAAAVWYTPAASAEEEQLVQELLAYATPAPATLTQQHSPGSSLVQPVDLRRLNSFLPYPCHQLSKRALAARRDSLRSHGILDQVPHVTPVMMLSGLPPLEYLHIQEMGTERPANDWTVAIFDTGADCALCSPAFAQRNQLTYGANSITVNTADGSSSSTLGELNRPLEFWLAKGSSHPCKAVCTVQVMAGVDKLFDLLISTEIITQWTAHICCMSSRLVYYPDFWTKGDRTGARFLPVMLCRPEPSEEEQAAE